MAGAYERFWALVDRSAGPHACWPWGGPVTAAGVGVFTTHRGRTTARRFAYATEYGDPGPLRVSVTCGLVLCMNWRCMVIRTARAVALGNCAVVAANAGRLVCPAGHDLGVDGAVYTHPGDGRRECAACKVHRRTR